MMVSDPVPYPPEISLASVLTSLKKNKIITTNPVTTTLRLKQKHLANSFQLHLLVVNVWAGHLFFLSLSVFCSSCMQLETGALTPPALAPPPHPSSGLPERADSTISCPLVGLVQFFCIWRGTQY